MATTTIELPGIGTYPIQVGSAPITPGALLSPIDAAIEAHEADANPHPVYLTQAEGDAMYAPIGAGGVFVQDTDPMMSAPGVWVETDGDDVVTFWVEVG